MTIDELDKKLNDDGQVNFLWKTEFVPESENNSISKMLDEREKNNKLLPKIFCGVINDIFELAGDKENLSKDHKMNAFKNGAVVTPENIECPKYGKKFLTDIEICSVIMPKIREWHNLYNLCLTPAFTIRCDKGNVYLNKTSISYHKLTRADKNYSISNAECAKNMECLLLNDLWLIDCPKKEYNALLQNMTTSEHVIIGTTLDGGQFISDFSDPIYIKMVWNGSKCNTKHDVDFLNKR